MLRAQKARTTLGTKPLILFHCASMGELEALYPLTHHFEKTKAALGVIYFSPSAENAAQKSEKFIFADYAPQDTYFSVRKFLRALKPQAFVISKHDIWPNIVWECERLQIPVFLINANFPPHSRRFWPFVSSFHKSVMGSLKAVLTVSPDDAKRARAIVPENVPLHVAGDSRYDRVAKRVQKASDNISFPQSSLSNRFVLVAGSTHADDENILLPAIAKVIQRHPEFLCLLVPHEPSPSALERVKAACKNLELDLQFLSQWQGGELGNILCVDRIGILAALYKFAHLAYVGGGFDKGVHSVLEPMIYGLPVLTGPNIEVSHEARLAREMDIIQLATEATQVENWIEGFITNENARKLAGKKASDFVKDRLGAAERTANFLKTKLDLH